MFAVLLARLARLMMRDDDDDSYILNYNETLLPGMRRFVGLWLRMGKWAIFSFIIGLPAAHYCAPGYAYGVAYFWSIYAPVCGIFFHFYHYHDSGEGSYYLNSGCATPTKMRSDDGESRF